jgi:uridine kinase
MARVVAIGGGSGAGKTTLARALAARLPEAVLLAEDDYYHCASTIAGFDAAMHNFDAPEAKDMALLALHLDRLRAGGAVELPVYDLLTHRRVGEARLGPARFVVLEGLHALADAGLRARIDLAVYVEAPADVRLARRLLRDVGERGRDWRSVVAQYLDHVRPMHGRHVEPYRDGADLVLEMDESAVERVLAALGEV